MHGTERDVMTNRVVAVSVFVNLALVGLKLVAGLVSRSNAMVADAVHSASDVITTLVVFVGLTLSRIPADVDHHYGHGKLEAVAAKIVALILTTTGLVVGWSSYQALRTGEIITPGTLAILAALASIVVKELLFRYTFKVGSKLDSTAIKADAWHNRADALSSVAALVGVIGARLGYTWADPVAGLFVALLVVRVGLKLYLSAIKELIDTAPSQEIMDKVRSMCTDVQGVLEVSNIKAMKMGPQIHFDIKIGVDGSISVEEGHKIAEDVAALVSNRIEKSGEVMVHVNPCKGKKCITQAGSKQIDNSHALS